MKIGKVAELTGVTRDTIRLYERMGLLKKVTRPFEFNNYKDYSEEHVDRVKLILMMKKVGLSLRECREILDKIEKGTFDEEFRQIFLQKKLDEIDRKIEELLTLKETLSSHLGGDCSGEMIEDINDSVQSIRE